jgi:enediyne biosynthesis protein E4
MDLRVARIILAVIFVGLLAAPVIVGRLSSGSAATVNIDADEVLSRYGFFLKEVSEEAGIDFTHAAPTLDPKLNHIMPQVASLGAAVSVVDFDRDGWQDLYVTNSGEGSRNALYRNLGDGTFEDVAAGLGVGGGNSREQGVSMGAVWGDYDNDGYEDLFLYKWGRSELYRNDQGQGFTRVTEGAGLPAWANINAGIWLDYDRDGLLDLFFGGFYAEDVNLWDLPTTRVMPESFEYAQNGGRKYLLRGRGNGTFEDVSPILGPDSRRWMLAVAAADLRGTGYPDLFIANDFGVAELFFNDSGQGFRAVGEQTNIGFAPKSGMNVSFGDILNNGRLAVYISNISEEGILMQGNNLWVPAPGTDGDQLKYQNMATTMGVDVGGWSYGAQFGDLNNDGHQDLMLTNGHVSLDQGQSYWYDYSKVAGGNRAIISDAQNWPEMENRSLSGYERKKLWLNDGTGRFQEVAQAVGIDHLYDGRAVALVDLWNRGVLDVVMAHQRGPLLIYKNTVALENAWLALELEGGPQSNRSAIGARVEVHWDGQLQVQEVQGGSGFASQNQRPLHFGLGQGVQVEKVVIRWPSGQLQTLTGLELNRLHRISEPSSDAANG